METYYEYNEYGDLLYQIMINNSDVNMLNGMYIENKYDDNRLVQQMQYNFQGELDEKQASDIVKSLK